MPVRQLERVDGLNISEHITEDESRVHTHYFGDYVSVVSVMPKASLDEQYSGESLECGFCDFEKDYSHTCDECEESFPSGSSLGGHMRKHNNEDGEEEE